MRLRQTRRTNPSQALAVTYCGALPPTNAGFVAQSLSPGCQIKPVVPPFALGNRMRPPGTPLQDCLSELCGIPSRLF